MRTPDNNEGTRSGFAVIAGKPNVGKSTLLNALVGEKVAIVSPKPNTTRNRISGIITRDDAQAVFLDTPGIHRPRDMLNRRLVKTAFASISEVDVILMMVVAGHKTDDIEKTIAEKASETRAKKFLLINKVDRVEKPSILPEIEERAEALGPFDEIVPTSALKGFNLDTVAKLVFESLPDGPHYYPDDTYTDLPEKFIAAEMIREQVFVVTQKEVPYATAVTVEEWTEKSRHIFVRARIHVERNSQKGIVIGNRGEKLKQIGVAARLEIEKMLGTKIYLELFVDVVPKWRRNSNMLDRLGYPEAES